MGFFKRLFSADYRAAVSAEAAGDLELAAERYALAGQIPSAVRMHLARASRAASRADEIAALYDALHWAERGTPCYEKAARALGRAQLARARAEGVATPRDRDRVREAAWLLSEAGEFEAAGEALESIADERGAAEAYRRGGFVEKMEELLAREGHQAEAERALREAFSRYEVHASGGQRDAAREALAECVARAEEKAEYRRLLDDLESRLITGGHVVLRPRRGERVALSARETVWLGRDALCDFVLRSADVSRQHARIERRTAADGGASFTLRDAGSRAGTTFGGLPVHGEVPLEGSGEIGLGAKLTLAFERDEGASLLALRITSGLDVGAHLMCAAEETPIPLERAGIPGAVVFRSGRPYFRATASAPTLSLGGERIAQGEVQLIRGDVLALGTTEVDVG